MRQRGAVLLQEQATTEYQNSIRRIARWVNKVIGKLDLTPSDSALALVLVATLQRKARRYIDLPSNLSISLCQKSSFGLFIHWLPSRIQLVVISDFVEGNILKTVCREKIRVSLQAARASQQGFTAISLAERAHTIRTLPELNAASGYQGLPSGRSRELPEEARAFIFFALCNFSCFWP